MFNMRLWAVVVKKLHGCTYTLTHLLNRGPSPNSVTIRLIQGLLVEANE